MVQNLPEGKLSAKMDNSSMTTSTGHAIPWHCWSSIFTERSQCSECCWVDCSAHACTLPCVLLRAGGNHETLHSECRAHSLPQFLFSWCVRSSLGQSCPYGPLDVLIFPVHGCPWVHRLSWIYIRLPIKPNSFSCCLLVT